MRVICCLLFVSLFRLAAANAADVSSSSAQPALSTPLSQRVLFHPHGSESAHVLRPWQMSYARVAGQDSIEGSFVMNSINVGVSRWLQVGTNPIFWAAFDSQNISAKAELYSSEHWAFALGYFHLNIKNFGGDGVLFSNGLSVISNWFIDQRWSTSYLVQASRTYAKFGIYELNGYSLPSQFLDLQYQVNSQLYLTSGVSLTTGQVARALSYLQQKSTPGAGTSLTWKLPRSWFFVYPSVGVHYYPEYGDISYLGSLMFQ